VLITGVAYKRDIDDMRESPAFDVMGLLHAKGAAVSYTDPYVPEIDARQWPGRIHMRSVPMGPGAWSEYDCVVIITDHRNFDYDAMVAESQLIVDTRNAIQRAAPHVFKLGAPRPSERDSTVALP
jgi:UDP-N-acetyl-D-glucosamine dehydrogenase